LKDWYLVGAILLVQAACTVFFVSDIVMNVIGFPAHPIAWQTKEFLELGAAVGLVLGVVLGALALRRTILRQRNAEQRLRVASGAFMDLLEEHFEQWGLTPAERDVALFAIKGMSTQDIAAMRKTSEGTVKAQTNAIYRKAGVTGRPQLLSLFIDDLMQGTVAEKVENGG
jgi:DNA-binding CsgD family transcriptional regulator